MNEEKKEQKIDLKDRMLSDELNQVTGGGELQDLYNAAIQYTCICGNQYTYDSRVKNKLCPVCGTSIWLSDRIKEKQY